MVDLYDLAFAKNISGGGTAPTLVEKSITANGVYNAADDNADGYSKVTVNVPNSYTAGDEGKVVDNGALVSQTALNVTRNGTYDTTTINSVNVNVTAVIYGIHIDPNEGDPSDRVTYLEDAVGATPAYMGATAFNYGSWENAFFMPKPCMLRYDGTVAYYLNPNDYSKKLDGTPSDIDNPDFEGNVMLEFPKIFYKYVPDESGNDGCFYVSNKRIDDTYECWSNYDADNNEIDHFYMAAYNGTSAAAYSAESTYAVGAHVIYSGAEYRCTTAVSTAEAWDSTKWEMVSSTPRLRSLSGVQLTPANGNGTTSGQEEMERARANNITAKDEWLIDLWADAILIWGLLYLIGKSTDVQGTFGRGIDSGGQAPAEAYVTGTLNDKGLFYGSTANGNTAVKVFGIENFWSCKWRRCAGFFGTSTGYAYKLTHGTKDGSTVSAFGTTSTGYITIAETHPESNYVKNMRIGKHGLIAKVTGSSATSNKFYCDYFYKGSSFALFGGYASYGRYCGVDVGLNYSVGARYWSVAAALSCKPLA